MLRYRNPLIAPSMDPVNFPAIGDPRAVGSKFGPSSGTSTDIIYHVSKQVDEAFQPGRTLELAWKSDQHRFFSTKNTRLMVEYEMMFGEVDSTCNNIETGPADSTGAGKGAPPSSALHMTCMPVRLTGALRGQQHGRGTVELLQRRSLSRPSEV